MLVKASLEETAAILIEPVLRDGGVCSGPAIVLKNSIT
jgi:acetylornithine/succinyldiaminopimelate/putrescine aminotransferase